MHSARNDAECNARGDVKDQVVAAVRIRGGPFTLA